MHAFSIKLASSMQGLPLASDLRFIVIVEDILIVVYWKISYSLCTRWLRRSCVTCWCHSFVGLLGTAIVLIALSWPDVLIAPGTPPIADAVFCCNGICGLFKDDICCLPEVPAAAFIWPPWTFKPCRPDWALPKLQFLCYFTLWLVGVKYLFASRSCEYYSQSAANYFCSSLTKL